LTFQVDGFKMVSLHLCLTVVLVKLVIGKSIVDFHKISEYDDLVSIFDRLLNEDNNDLNRKTVVLLRIGQLYKTRVKVQDISDEVVSSIARKSFLILPELDKESKNKTFRKPDVIIIVSGLHETVSFLS
jgi:hypothetical protein